MNFKGLLLTILLFVVHGLHADGKDVNATGKLVDGNVQLFWSLDKWPEDLLGFDVERTIKDDANAEAVRVNKHLIRPEMTFARAKKLRDPELYNSLLKAEKHEKPRKVLLDLLNAKKDQTRTYCKMLWGEIDLATLYGLGFVDKTAELNKEYQYNIYPVTKSGKSKTSLYSLNVSTSCRIVSCPVEEIQVSRNHKGSVYLRWKVREKQFKASRISGFELYRGVVDKAVVRKLFPESNSSLALFVLGSTDFFVFMAW